MKTVVLQDICIGCGLCPNLSPDIYEMDGADKAFVVDDHDLSPKEVIEAREAADSCPVDAIEVR